MTELRAAKVAGIADEIGELVADDPDGADLLVLGLGVELRRDHRRRQAGPPPGRSRSPAPTCAT